MTRLGALPNNIKIHETPKESYFPEAEAVILYDYTYAEISSMKNFGLQTYYDVHTVTKVFRNFEKFHTYDIVLDDGEEFDSFSARTIKPDGTIVEVEPMDVFVITQKRSAANYQHDEQLVRFKFPAVSKNCIIELKYRLIVYGIEMKNLWKIQKEQPVLENIYKLTVPKELLIRNFLYYKVYNYPLLVEKAVVEDDFVSLGKTFTWKARNVSGYKPEKMTGYRFRYIPHIKFFLSPMRNWNDFADYYYYYFFNRKLDISNEVRKKAQELTVFLQSETEKIDAVRKFVSNFVNDTDQLSFRHWYKLNDPGTVLRRGYGDSKDKSILIIAMLESLGIESYPVLVETKEKGYVDPDLLSNDFDRMIVKAVSSDKKNIFIDGTLQNVALGSLDELYTGTYALVLTHDKKAKPEKLPETTWHDNGEMVNAVINIKPDFSAEIKTAFIFKGSTNIWIRNKLRNMDNADIIAFCRSLINDDYFNIKVEGLKYSDVKSFGNDFEVSFSFSVNDLLQKSSIGYSIYTNPSDNQMWYIIKYLYQDKRVAPFDFEMPYSIDYTTEINYPVDKLNLAEVQAPAEFALPENDINFTFKSSEDKPGHIIINSVFVMQKPVILENKYDAMKKLFDEIIHKVFYRLYFKDAASTR